MMRQDCANVNQIVQHPIPSNPPGSYYVPSQSEIKAIEELISLSDEAIAQLEADLAHVRRFKAYQSQLIAPIRRIPNEVLGNMFMHVISGTSIDIGRKGGAIWDLLDVCVRWRDVVESTPELWSNFTITRLFDVKRSEVKSRIQKCLKLSKATPLTITLLPVMLHSISKVVICDIFAEYRRWRSITTHRLMFLLPNGLSHPLFPRGLHQLRELHIKKCRNNLETLVSFPVNILTSPDKLETFSIHRLFLHDHLEYLPSVRRLKLRMCLGSFLSTLIKMPNLEEFTSIRFDFSVRIINAAPVPDEVKLASLHTMNISTVLVDDVWSKLYVPKLTNFRLQHCTQNAETFLRMIDHSSSVIKRLRLDYCSLGTELGFLQQLRDVEELTISLTPSPGMNTIFEALIWSSEQCDSPQSEFGNLVPSLRTLVFNIVKENEGPTIPPLITAIMQSRAAHAVSKSVGKEENAPVPLLKLRCNVYTSFDSFPSAGFIYYYSASLKRTGNKAGVDVQVVIKTAGGDLVSDTADENEEREVETCENVELLNIPRYDNSEDDRSSHGRSRDYIFGEDGSEVAYHGDFDEDDILSEVDA